MTMTPERLAELDAVMARVQPILQRMTDTLNDPVRDSAALLHLNNYALDAVAIALASIPDLRAHIEALAATIARMRGALEPFAKEAACWDEEQNGGFSFPDHEPLEMESQLQVKHLRAARAALTGAA